MAEFKCPKGCEGVSLLGEWFPADKRGVVTVPDVPHDLEANGFVPFVEPPAKAKVQGEQ